jgi:hypothetical protein
LTFSPSCLRTLSFPRTELEVILFLARFIFLWLIDFSCIIFYVNKCKKYFFYDGSRDELGLER